MGIFEFLKSKNLNNQTKGNKSANIVENTIPFVPDLSMVELQNINWGKFARDLKENNVLGNSYDNRDIAVTYSLDENNRPMVELVFVSNTSDSVRVVQLFQDNALISVNNEMVENKALDKVWKTTQNAARWAKSNKNNREMIEHLELARKYQEKANKLFDFETFFDDELDFLKEHQNDAFDSCEWDQYDEVVFVVKEHTEGDSYTKYSVAKPFSPKTLEFCVNKLTKEAKEVEGQNIGVFTQKCKDIKNRSVYNSEDWDKVIANAGRLVEKAYRNSISEDIRIG